MEFLVFWVAHRRRCADPARRNAFADKHGFSAQMSQPRSARKTGNDSARDGDGWEGLHPILAFPPPDLVPSPQGD